MVSGSNLIKMAISLVGVSVHPCSLNVATLIPKTLSVVVGPSKGTRSLVKDVFLQIA
jgi:hypothetical protein